jgi:AAHS family 4-hydroxybenzoate transporter-like MFS transporter
MIILCAFLMGTGVFFTAFAQTLPQLIIFRFFSGIGIGSMLACTSTMTAEYAPEKTKNFWVSFVMSGYPVGAVLSGLVATNLIAGNGWQAMYYFAGAAHYSNYNVVFKGVIGIFIESPTKKCFAKSK